MKLLNILLIILIPIILFLSPIIYLSTSTSFYQKEINNPNVLQNINKTQAQEISNQVILYLKGETELEESLVGTDAKQHMKDVKSLRNISKYFLYSLILLFIIGIVITKNHKILIFGSIATLILNFILFLISKISFTFAFTKFHELFFRNSLWKLNPETDALVRVFSEQFFIDFLYEVVLLSTIFALFLCALGMLLGYFIKKRGNASASVY